jgi:hypothetical protein
MSANRVVQSAPPQKNDTDLGALCEKIRREAVLTPPAIIDALCEGVPTPWICIKAIFVEELRELARKLDRGYLLRFTADC